MAVLVKLGRFFCFHSVVTSSKTRIGKRKSYFCSRILKIPVLYFHFPTIKSYHKDVGSAASPAHSFGWPSIGRPPIITPREMLKHAYCIGMEATSKQKCRRIYEQCNLDYHTIRVEPIAGRIFFLIFIWTFQEQSRWRFPNDIIYHIVQKLPEFKDNGWWYWNELCTLRIWDRLFRWTDNNLLLNVIFAPKNWNNERCFVRKFVYMNLSHKFLLSSSELLLVWEKN